MGTGWTFGTRVKTIKALNKWIEELQHELGQPEGYDFGYKNQLNHDEYLGMVLRERELWLDDLKNDYRR